MSITLLRDSNDVSNEGDGVVTDNEATVVVVMYWSLLLASTTYSAEPLQTSFVTLLDPTTSMEDVSM